MCDLPRAASAYCLCDGWVFRYSFVTETLNYPSDSIVVCGESIGSVATVHVAQAKPVRRWPSHALHCRWHRRFGFARAGHSFLVTFHITHPASPVTLCSQQRNSSRPRIFWSSRHIAKTSRFYCPRSHFFSSLKTCCVFRIRRSHRSYSARSLCDLMSSR